MKGRSDNMPNEKKTGIGWNAIDLADFDSTDEEARAEAEEQVKDAAERVEYRVGNIDQAVKDFHANWKEIAGIESANYKKSNEEMKKWAPAFEDSWNAKREAAFTPNVDELRLYNQARKTVSDGKLEVRDAKSLEDRKKLSDKAAKALMKTAEDIYLSEESSLTNHYAAKHYSDYYAYAKTRPEIYGTMTSYIDAAEKGIDAGRESEEYRRGAALEANFQDTVRRHAILNAEDEFKRLQKMNTMEDIISNWDTIRKSTGVYQDITPEDIKNMGMSEEHAKKYAGYVNGIRNLSGIYEGRMELLASGAGKYFPTEEFENVSSHKYSKLLMGSNKAVGASDRFSSDAVMFAAGDNRSAFDNQIKSVLERISECKDSYMCSQLERNLNFKFRGEATFMTPDGKNIQYEEALKNLKEGKHIYAISAADNDGIPKMIAPADRNGNLLIGEDQIKKAKLSELQLPPKPGFFARTFDRMLQKMGLDSLRSKKCVEYSKALENHKLELERNERLQEFKKIAEENPGAPTGVIRTARAYSANRKNAHEPQALDYRDKLLAADGAAYKKLKNVESAGLSEDGQKPDEKTALGMAADIVAANWIRKLVKNELKDMDAGDNSEISNNAIMDSIRNAGKPEEPIENLSNVLKDNKQFADAVGKMSADDFKEICSSKVSQKGTELLKNLSDTVNAKKKADKQPAAGKNEPVKNADAKEIKTEVPAKKGP